MNGQSSSKQDKTWKYSRGEEGNKWNRQKIAKNGTLSLSTRKGRRHRVIKRTKVATKDAKSIKTIRAWFRAVCLALASDRAYCLLL